MHKVFILLGPTASGKSKLSMKLSKDFPFEIINADLYSVYKGLDIGTANPSNVDLKSTRHHLIDIIEQNKNYKEGRAPIRLNRDFKVLTEAQEKENKIWQQERICEYLNNFPVMQLIADEV